MYQLIGKRLLDIFLVILGFPFYFLIFLIFVPLIYLEDKENPFYNAPRVGKNGKIFKMFKFRSMKVDAPDIRNKDGSTYNSEDDPRLTKIGSFIRKTSIDEVPQIINVIKNEMSFIGPRPDLPDALRMFNNSEKQKFLVKPGISGYNQAYYRNSIELKERISNDLFYVKNLSFKLDIKIILKTIRIILLRENVYFK